MKENLFKTILWSMFLFLFIFQSCRRCKNLDFCEMPKTSQEYFKNYINGTSWIYFSHDSTKRDSVYVDNYLLNIKSDKLDRCIEWDRQEMSLNSNYLSTEKISCLYENPNCDKSYFILQGLTTSVEIHSKIDVDTLFTLSQSSNIKMIDSLVLHNGSKFFKVERYDNRLWFAPTVGLVQFISFNNIDTFYLHKIIVP